MQTTALQSYYKTMINAANDMAVARATCKNDPIGSGELARKAFRTVCTASAPSDAQLPPWPITADPVLMFAFKHSATLVGSILSKQSEIEAREHLLHSQQIQDAVALFERLSEGRTIRKCGHSLRYDSNIELLTGTNPYGADFFAGELSTANLNDWLIRLGKGQTMGAAPALEPMAEHTHEDQALLELKIELSRLRDDFQQLIGMYDLAFTDDFTNVTTGSPNDCERSIENSNSERHPAIEAGNVEIRRYA